MQKVFKTHFKYKEGLLCSFIKKNYTLSIIQSFIIFKNYKKIVSNHFFLNLQKIKKTFDFDKVLVSYLSFDELLRAKGISGTEITSSRYHML